MERSLISLDPFASDLFDRYVTPPKDETLALFPASIRPEKTPRTLKRIEALHAYGPLWESDGELPLNVLEIASPQELYTLMLFVIGKDGRLGDKCHYFMSDWLAANTKKALEKAAPSPHPTALTDFDKASNSTLSSSVSIETQARQAMIFCAATLWEKKHHGPAMRMLLDCASAWTPNSVEDQATARLWATFIEQEGKGNAPTNAMKRIVHAHEHLSLVGYPADSAFLTTHRAIAQKYAKILYAAFLEIHPSLRTFPQTAFVPASMEKTTTALAHLFLSGFIDSPSPQKLDFQYEPDLQLQTPQEVNALALVLTQRGPAFEKALRNLYAFHDDRFQTPDERKAFDEQGRLALAVWYLQNERPLAAIDLAADIGLSPHALKDHQEQASRFWKTTVLEVSQENIDDAIKMTDLLLRQPSKKKDETLEALPIEEACDSVRRTLGDKLFAMRVKKIRGYNYP